MKTAPLTRCASDHRWLCSVRRQNGVKSTAWQNIQVKQEQNNAEAREQNSGRAGPLQNWPRTFLRTNSKDFTINTGK